MLMIIILVCTLQTALSSIVIDKAVQEGIIYEDYCPQMKYCPEGTHVMCMYYDPNHIAGPKCNNFQNLSITYEVADKLLFLVNEMRGRAAMGIETSNDVKLPRAFGLFKLKWDNELATFAQVMANTCQVTRDLCRATNRFPEAGQIGSGVQFTFLEWFPVDHQDAIPEPGFTDNEVRRKKIMYTAYNGFNDWYNKKNLMTADIIKRIPNLHSRPVDDVTRLDQYMQLVDGATTHMGCGLSAFTRYDYRGIPYSVKYFLGNFIFIVCNFSNRPTAGREVYKTTNDYGNPAEGHYSKCGCPPGAVEDDMCLCSWNATIEPTNLTCKDDNCNPAVLILPIFTVDEGWTPEKLKIERPSESLKRNKVQSFGNEALQENNISNRFELFRDNRNLEHRRQQLLSGIPPYTSKRVSFGNKRHKHPSQSGGFSDSDQPKFISRYLKPKPKIYLKSPVTRHSFLSYNPMAAKNYYMPKEDYESYSEFKPKPNALDPDDVEVVSDIEPSPTSNTPSEIVQEENIFGNPKLQLTDHNIHNTDTAQPVIMDVAKRNDFSAVQQLAKIYLIHKSQTSDVNKQQKPTSLFLNETMANDADDLNPQNIEFNKPDQQSTNTKDLASQNEEYDQKLISLLDTLEQEIKLMHMGAGEKEILNNKIRKIYETVVGYKSEWSNIALNPEMHLHNSYPLDIINNPNVKSDMEMYDTEDEVNEMNTNRVYLKRNIKQRQQEQNTAPPYKESFKDTFNVLNAIDNIQSKAQEHYKKPKHRTTSNVTTKHKDRKVIVNYVTPKQTKAKQFARRNNKVNFQSRHPYKYRPNNQNNRKRHFIKVHNSFQTEADTSGYLSQEFVRRPSDHYTGEKFDDYEFENGALDLSIERKKYYQDRLNSLGPRGQHGNRRDKYPSIRLRKIKHDIGYDRLDTDPPHYYSSDRARFLESY